MCDLLAANPVPCVCQQPIERAQHRGRTCQMGSSCWPRAGRAAGRQRADGCVDVACAQGLLNCLLVQPDRQPATPTVTIRSSGLCDARSHTRASRSAARSTPLVLVSFASGPPRLVWLLLHSTHCSWLKAGASLSQGKGSRLAARAHRTSTSSRRNTGRPALAAGPSRPTLACVIPFRLSCSERLVSLALLPFTRSDPLAKPTFRSRHHRPQLNKLAPIARYRWQQRHPEPSPASTKQPRKPRAWAVPA